MSVQILVLQAELPVSRSQFFLLDALILQIRFEDGHYFLLFVEEVVISAELSFQLGYFQLQELVLFSQLLITQTCFFRSTVWRSAFREVLLLHV